MKKCIIIFSSVFLALFAQAFSFGDLVKKATSTTEQSEAEKSLVCKQESAIKKYKESKVEFLKGFSIIAGELGATDLKKTADNALAKIETQSAENFDTDATLKVTSDVATLVKSGDVAEVASKVASSNEATKNYNEGLTHLKTALSGELDAAKMVKDLSVEAHNAIKNASSNTEKLKLTASLKPSFDLAKTIPSDISGAKEAISSLLPILKSKGADISDILSSVER